MRAGSEQDGYVASLCRHCALAGLGFHVGEDSAGGYPDPVDASPVAP
jgi:hypothetical protein